MKLSYGFRPFPELQSSNPAWGRSLCPIFQDRATEFHSLEEKYAIVGSTHELLLSQNFEDFLNLFFVLLQALVKDSSRGRGNQKVVDVNAAELLYIQRPVLLKQDVVHHFMKQRRCIVEAQSHHSQLNSATGGVYRRQMPILLSKGHLMEAMTQIQQAEELAFCPLGSLLLN